MHLQRDNKGPKGKKQRLTGCLSSIKTCHPKRLIYHPSWNLSLHWLHWNGTHPNTAHNLLPWKANSRTKLKWLITQDGKETICQRIICAWLEIKADDSQTEVQHKNKLFHMPRGWYILPVSQIFILLRELQAAVSPTCTLHNSRNNQRSHKSHMRHVIRDFNSQFEKWIRDQTEECSSFHRFHPSSVNCCFFPVWATGTCWNPTAHCA